MRAASRQLDVAELDADEHAAVRRVLRPHYTASHPDGDSAKLRRLDQHSRHAPTLPNRFVAHGLHLRADRPARRLHST
jgi:hypothetical protein